MKKKVNSRAKGKRGELEAAKLIAATFNVNARRGQQFAGSSDSPDVVSDVDGIHWEIKRVERLDVLKAVKQAVRDAGDGKVPVVLHRKNSEEWLLTLRFADIKNLVDKLSSYLDLGK